MAVEESQQFCARCQRLVLARRPGTNHIFHLLMCVFTCGLWVIPWFLSSAKVGGWRCSLCGGTAFGQAYGAPGGAAPVKSSLPRALMLVGAGIGAFFFLVIVLAIVAGRSSSSSKPAPVDTAAAERRAEKNQAEAWTAARDVEELGSIRAGQVKPTDVDRTGDKLEIHNHHVSGWKMATFAKYKASPGAWKLSVEGGFGDGCRPQRWAPYVTLIENEGTLPLQASWFRLGGGPLDGLVVKGFVNSSDCMFHFATPEYATLQGWKHTR